MIISRSKDITKKLVKFAISFSIISSVTCFLIIAYIASLIIAKPREIQFLDTLIESALKEHYPTANFDVGNAVISWDKEQFSFNLNLQQVNFKIEDTLNISTPHVILDISRRNLILGRFIIDNAILTGAKITLQNTLHDKNNLDPKRLLEHQVSIPVLIKNLEIYKANLFLFETQIELEKLKFRTRNEKALLSLLVRNNNHKISSNSKCIVSAKNTIKSCTGKIQNLNNEIFASITNIENFQKSSFIFDTNFEINFSKQTASIKSFSQDGNYYKNSNQKIQWDKFELSTYLDFQNQNINFDKIYISNDTNNFNGSFEYNLPSNNIKLEIKSYKGSKNFLLKLWPQNIAPKLHKWLTLNLNTMNIVNSDLKSQLDLKHKKFQYFDLNIVFDNTELKFAKKLNPLKASSGTLKISDNTLKIDIDKGLLDEIKITKLEAIINKVLVKKIHHLETYVETSSDIADITKYLVKNDLKKFNFSGNTTSKIKLNIPIKKGTKLNKVSFESETKVTNLNFKYFLENSDAIIKLSKNSTQDFIIKSQIICNDCNLDIPIIAYPEHISQKENFKFKIDATPNQLKITDIKNNINDKLNIDGDIIFDEFNKLKTISFENTKVNKSIFNFNVKRNVDSFNLDVNAKTLDINAFKFFRNATEKKKTPTLITVNAEQIFLHSNKFAENLTISSYFNENDLFKLVSLNIPSKTPNNSFIKAIQKSNIAENINNIDIEIHDLGNLLDNLNIANSITSGSAILNIVHKKEETNGKLYFNNLEVKSNKLLKKINEIISLGISDSKFIRLSKSNGDFTILDNQLTLKNFKSIGSNIGFTSKGSIDLPSLEYKFEGVIVPASSINSLLGIKNIPIVGSIITGGKDEGIISAKYQVSGSYHGSQTFKINPLSTLTPSFLRNLFNIPFKEKN